MSPANGDNGLTFTVLGCGNLGTAILSGILDSLVDLKSQSTSETSEELPPQLPSRFIACVRSPASAKRLRSQFSKYEKTYPLTVNESDNLSAVKAADVVLLGCKPYMVSTVLSAPGIKDALAGKLLLSILAGVPEEQIEAALYPDQTHAQIIESGGCTVVRAMPNVAAAVRESMTVIATRSPPLPDQQNKLVEWIFNRIGKVVQLPAANMDAATALCGSGPAFMALVLDALCDGAVAMGIPRKDAQTMAAQMMRGTTGLVLEGEHPALLKDKVCTPGGCTIGGLLVLEEGTARGTIARAVREATVVASQLGKGVQGVNGTRH